MLSLEITHKMAYDIAVNDTESDSRTRLYAINHLNYTIEIVVQKIQLFTSCTSVINEFAKSKMQIYIKQLSLEITHKMAYDIAVNDTENDLRTRL